MSDTTTKEIKKDVTSEVQKDVTNNTGNSSEATRAIKESKEAIAEAKEIVTEATDHDKVADDQAPRVQVETNIHSLLYTGFPIVNMAFSATPRVMTSPTLQASFIKPKDTIVSAKVEPGQNPVETDMLTIKRTISYGKYWKYDSILKEDLIERWYQVKNNNLSVDGNSAHPVALMANNLGHELLREMNEDFSTGTANGNGFNVRGYQTQHAAMTSSTGLTAGTTDNLVEAGNSNFNYSLAKFSNSEAGETAIAKDIMSRIRMQKFYYGANSHTIFVPAGNADYARQILLKYKNTIEQQVVQEVKQSGDLLTLDNLQEDGTIRIDRSLRVVEDNTLSAGEVYILPDSVRGIINFQPYEYRADDKTGFRVIVDFGSGQVRDLLNTSVGDFEEIIFKSITGVETAHVSMQWTGQVVAQLAMYGIKYTQAEMFSANYLDTIASFNQADNANLDPIAL